MTTSTSPISVFPQHRAPRRLTRRQENRMLARRLRQRNRARVVNDITWRYRHAMTILAALGATTIGIVVGHLLLTAVVR